MHAETVMVEAFIIAILGPVAMYFCLREKTAAAIRRSMLWPLAVLVYINICGFTVQAWFMIFEHYGIQLPPEEIGVPVFFGLMLLITGGLFYIKAYRPYRRMLKELKD